MKQIFSIIVLVLMAVGACAAPVQAEDCEKMIQTQAAAEVSGRNDSMIVSFAVVTESGNLSRANSENAEKAKKVMAAVKALKIPGMKIETANFQVIPKKDYKMRPYRIVGYEVQNSIDVTIEKAGPETLSGHGAGIMAAAMASGANRISRIHFYIKDMDVLENSALASATRKAKKRAGVMAEAAGVKIKKIVSIESVSASAGPAPRVMRANVMAAEEAAAPPIETGESSIRMQVRICAEIE